MLWMYQRVFYGEASETCAHHMPDLNAREWAAIVPLIVMMVWMGVYSQTLPAADQRSNTRAILEQTNVNVPFQVQLPTAAIRPVRGGRQCPLISLPDRRRLLRFLPEIILTVAGTLLMVLEADAAPSDRRNAFGHISHRGAAGRARRRVYAYRDRRTGVSAAC